MLKHHLVGRMSFYVRTRDGVRVMVESVSTVRDNVMISWRRTDTGLRGRTEQGAFLRSYDLDSE